MGRERILQGKVPISQYLLLFILSIHIITYVLEYYIENFFHEYKAIKIYLCEILYDFLFLYWVNLHKFDLLNSILVEVTYLDSEILLF